MKLFGELMMRLSLILALSTLLAACSTTKPQQAISKTKPVTSHVEKKPTGLNLLSYPSQPQIKLLHFDDSSFENIKTFALLSSECLGVELSSSPRLENTIRRQIAYQLRNSLELRGYQFVKAASQPDLYLSIESVTSKEKQFLQELLPIEQQKTCSLKSSFQYGEFSSINDEVYRLVNASNIGNNKPAARIRAYRNDQLSFDILGRAKSNNSNSLANSQTLIRKLTKILPAKPKLTAGKKGFGFATAIMSQTGKRYFPVVTRISYSSSANIEGLNVGDTIVSINGVSTQNTSFSEVTDLLTDKQELSVGIIREGHYQNFSLSKRPL